MANNSHSRVQRRKQKRKKKKGKLHLRKVFMTLFLLFFIAGIGIIGLFFTYIKDAPKLVASELSDPISAKIYDMDEQLIADLGTQKRTKIEYDDLPQVLIDAVIATEDARFFDHAGFDFQRILAAAWANVTDGFGAEGASTITQQVVKNAFLTFDKKLERKVQEVWLAMQLEMQYSKKEILTMYLNKIYYGNQIYGVAKAAEVYFGKKDLSELTLPEAALLAGIPQLPNVYDPFDHPDKADKRKNIVLDLMVHHGKISEEEAEQAKKVKAEELVVDNYVSNTPYEDFLEVALDEVQEKLGDDIDIYSDGIKIYTTLDQHAQSYVEKMLSKNSPIEFPDHEFQAGIAVIDTKTGAIRAIGGGRNGKDGIGADWNYATDGDGRQPGSTMKPLLDYAPAIEKLNWSTYHQIKDEKYTYSTGDPIRNWNDSYKGWMSMREALRDSINVPALKALQEVGLDYAENFIKQLGIDIPEKGIVEADAIGGGRIHVTPLEMAGAYASFGNQGIYNEPYAVRKVVLQNGKTIDFTPDPVVAMSDYTAYMITDMLKTVVTRGTGTQAYISGLPVAGKTGTTNRGDKTPDSWFNGYTTNYTISIWTGYPDERNIPNSQIAEYLFKYIMSELSKGKETKDFIRPDVVKEIAVEKGSRPAKLPGDYTPQDQIVYELFIKGTEPTEISQKYKQLHPVSDLQAEYQEAENAIQLNWKYHLDSEEQEDQNTEVIFEIQAAVNDQPMELITTTSETSILITDVNKGDIYTFEVTAVNGENPDNTSEPSIVQITVPEERSIDDIIDEILNGDGRNNENNGSLEQNNDPAGQDENVSEENSQTENIGN
ncbi:MAG: PBP1A family penicillin-binding protein [Bacillaceae bacterium]|nr:PBP1A family penicillin-binding protein [Bacillaceae bacterium]